MSFLYIFDRFYQAKNAGRGTGIGLANRKVFTELHQWRSKCYKYRGKGSSLYYSYIPVRQKGVTNQPTEKIGTIVCLSSVEEVPNQVNIYELIQFIKTDRTRGVNLIDDNIDIRTLFNITIRKYNVRKPLMEKWFGDCTEKWTR